MLIGALTNPEAFVARCFPRTAVEKVLTPTLKPGDIVIMNNLGSHRGEAGLSAWHRGPIQRDKSRRASNYPGKIIARSFVDRSRALITRITRIAKNGVC
jgi:hypothetical protein